MSLSATLEQPTLDQLVRHAHLFGTECVYETGEQEGLPNADLACLRIELDELDAGRKSKHGFSIGNRRRRSSDETRAAALALSVDGFVPKAIADKLGISDRTVRSYLKQSPRSPIVNRTRPSRTKLSQPASKAVRAGW